MLARSQLAVTAMLLLACAPLERPAAPRSNVAPADSVPRVPVTLALRENDHRPASYRIIRSPAPNARDVVLLTGDVTDLTLTAAVHELLLLRRIQGDTATTGREVRIRPRSSAPAVARPYPWAAKVLADWGSAAEEVILGIRRVRTVVIWLPPQFVRRPAG